MLGSVYWKTLWEHRVPILWWVGGAMSLAGFLVAVFPSISAEADLQAVIDVLPAQMLALFGVDPATFQTAAGYLQAQLYSFAAPILLVTLGIRMGARATAGEEQAGTIDLLLANPISRDRLTLDKLLAMTTLLGLVVLGITAVLLIGNELAGLGLRVAGIVGANLGLLLVSLLFGALAAALGAWLGRPGMAGGITAGLAVAAFLADGFAPLVDGLEVAQRASPFSWYQAGQPLLTGPTGHHLLLAAWVAVFGVATLAGFRGRDLAVERRLAPALRWRAHGRRQRVRLPVLLCTVSGKTLWERRVAGWWWAGGLMALAGITVALWPTVERGQDAFGAVIASMPPELLALLGFPDPQVLLTPAGFISSRVYTGVGLILVLALAIGMGGGAVAGEEAGGTMDLLLANPISRDRIVLEKYLAMATMVAAVATGLLAVLVAGDLALDLGLSAGGIVAANVGLALIALIFGGLALAAGAATGRPGVAMGVAGGAAAGAYILNGVGAIVAPLRAARRLSPFFWYLGDATPLASGPSAWLLLALVAAVLPVLAVTLFRRRSIA